jgi:glycosyltransferase involved in cell wall biosynthesis
MTKVSVIICTYNSAKVIEKTLACVFEQEGLGREFELEVLVIDDQSTDQTKALCAQFPVLFLQNEYNSGGPNKGRNVGLRMATGTYICLCDHDDHWEPSKLKNQLAVCKQAPIISGAYQIIDTQNKRSIRRGNKISSPLLFKKNETFLQLLQRHYRGQVIYLSGLLFSAELKHIEFEEQYGFLDYDWLVRLFENQTSIELPNLLFTRYVEGKNLSFNEKYRVSDHQAGISLLEQYQLRYPKESRIGIQKFHGTLARYYYLINQLPKSRRLLLKSGLFPKNWFFFLTSYFGHRLVRRYIHFFG